MQTLEKLRGSALELRIFIAWDEMCQDEKFYARRSRDLSCLLRRGVISAEPRGNFGAVCVREILGDLCFVDQDIGTLA